MTKRVARAGVLLLSAGVAGSCSQAAQTASNSPARMGGYTITGPYTHQNLSVFLIHGQERLPNRSFLTLQEAIDQKKAVVHETGDVNQLAIENVSPDQEVYLQAGDIVKGGRQDRMISVDLSVPPRSGRIPIASFCVEQGRWTRRGQESAAMFNASSDQIAGKALKIAARSKADQGEVWREVAAAQEKLSANLGTPVRSGDSASSLQLTLEDGNVKRSIESYLARLSKVADGKRDVIGYAFAVNGQVNSVEIYGSRSLFTKLWPKLLKAAAVEAVAEAQKGKAFTPASADAVKACMSDAEKGRATEKDVTARVKLVTRETDKNVFFETRDAQDEKAWLHRSYIVK